MSAVYATVQVLVSVLVWKDARTEWPDDSTTVLVAFSDGETAHGYFDSADGVWRSQEAARFCDEVEFWAECPEPPRRGAEKEGA